MTQPATKLVRFLAGDRSLPGRVRDLWRATLDRIDEDPDRGAAPVRVTLSTVLDLGLDLGLHPPPAPFVAVDVAWFETEAAARDASGWLRSRAPGLALDAPGFEAGSCALVVEELALRGADYLEARWATGGDRFKMMSFGRRHPDLTRAEFAARWRGEAGRVGGETIPEAVRGLAYVQDHPVDDLVDARSDPEFDAVNEVWFERVEELEARVRWLVARLAEAPGAAGLMSPTETWSLALREELLAP